MLQLIIKIYNLRPLKVFAPDRNLLDCFVPLLKNYFFSYQNEPFQTTRDRLWSFISNISSSTNWCQSHKTFYTNVDERWVASSALFTFLVGWHANLVRQRMLEMLARDKPGNTKGGRITVKLTSCLIGLDQSVLQIKTKIVSSHTADSKPVKQEVNGTVILPLWYSLDKHSIQRVWTCQAIWPPFARKAENCQIFVAYVLHSN